VKDVVLGAARWGGAELAWQFNHAQGDMDLDGRIENLLFGQNAQMPGGPPSSGRQVCVLMNGYQSSRHFSFNQTWPSAQTYLLSPAGWQGPVLATLDSPLGALVVGLEAQPERYVVRELTTGRFVGAFVEPPPPPGYPPIFSIRGIFRAPDINNDGWEDLFFQATADSYAVCGLIDGFSLTGIWMRYEARYAGFAPIFMPDYGRRGDLNGDTVPDFLFGYQRNDAPPINDVIMRVVAVSGSNGARIWATEVEEFGQCGFGGIDVTGDSIEDVLLNTVTSVSALDGSTGAILWKRDASDFHYLVAGSTAITPYFAEQAIISRWPGQGNRKVGIVPLRHSRTGWIGHHHLYIVLDMSTGQFLEAHDTPMTLAPWSIEETESRHGYAHHFCGDVDGDGYQDFARRIDAPLWDTPSSPATSFHMVYFGPKTLYLPEAVPSGTSANGWVSLPAAANCDYHMIGSLTFDPEGGVVHDGFPTNLVQDRFFNQFLGHGFVRGILDADGEATFAFPVPKDQALIGKTMHLRILATPPGDPWKLKTMSTVARVTIMP